MTGLSGRELRKKRKREPVTFDMYLPGQDPANDDQQRARQLEQRLSALRVQRDVIRDARAMQQEQPRFFWMKKGESRQQMRRLDTLEGEIAALESQISALKNRAVQNRPAGMKNHDLDDLVYDD